MRPLLKRASHRGYRSGHSARPLRHTGAASRLRPRIPARPSWVRSGRPSGAHAITAVLSALRREAVLTSSRPLKNLTPILVLDPACLRPTSTVAVWRHQPRLMSLAPPNGKPSLEACAHSTGRSPCPRHSQRGRAVTLDGYQGQAVATAATRGSARALAGLKGHTTNLADCPDGTPITAEFVISSYHQLWQIAQKRRRGWFSPVIARPAPAHQYPDVGTPLTNWYASNEDASRP